MSSDAPILVFGATGNIASSLVHQLHAAKVALVATVRDTTKAKAKLGSDVQLVQLVDFKDAAAVKAAVHNSGAKRAFALLDLITADTLNALKAGGLTHLVTISTTVVGLPTEPMPLQQWTVGLEDAVKASGLTYSILRADSFMSNCNQHQHQHQHQHHSRSPIQQSSPLHAASSFSRSLQLVVRPLCVDSAQPSAGKRTTAKCCSLILTSQCAT